MRIVVSGGGTGGHIMPALAVAEALSALEPAAEILYIGSTSGMETQLVPKYGVAYQAVTARKLRKLISPSTVGVALSLLKGYTEARAYLRAFKAQAVVSTGGYVAGATALAGARLRLPAVLLEGNAVPGRTNLLAARYASRVCVVFPDTADRFPRGKAVVTGLPLRAGVVLPESVTPQEARCRLEGLRQERFTVLVMGGSQGARALNERMAAGAARIVRAGAQVLHQTGERHLDSVRGAIRQHGIDQEQGYVTRPFLDAAEVPLALRAADLIVCRGGISTLSEVMVNGVPAIVVPLPTAYADHQTLNAQALERAGAALVRPEAELTGDAAADDILKLMESPETRERMSAASRAMGRPDAARDVARLTLNLIG
jgi:UDP-N-acetylglucosamine--N-acetylmuramyl-(pentapeptide) pyrophosphoryl-undecaprenol N-acetylglucosamine transferase